MTNPPHENVQSFSRPPALEPVPQRITIRLRDVLAAETTRGLRALETRHAPSYNLPPEDIAAALHPASGGCFCEWKGAARYFELPAIAASALFCS